MDDQLQVSFSEEELQEFYSLDGVYEEIINYDDISVDLGNIVYSKEFIEKEKKYLENNIM